MSEREARIAEARRHGIDGAGWKQVADHPCPECHVNGTMSERGTAWCPFHSYYRRDLGQSDWVKKKIDAQRRAGLTPADVQAMADAIDFGENPAAVTIDRKLLEEALDQIEETSRRYTGDEDGDDLSCCAACGRDCDGGPIEDYGHKPDCRYVRVRDALKKAIGK